MTGPAGGPYNVEFTQSLGQAEQPPLTADGSLLTSDVSAAVTETTKGTPGTNETQRISVPAGTTGGTFTLTFNGNTTGPIPTDATAAKVLDEVQQLGFDPRPGQCHRHRPERGAVGYPVREPTSARSINRPSPRTTAICGAVSRWASRKPMAAAPTRFRRSRPTAPPAAPLLLPLTMGSSPVPQAPSSTMRLPVRSRRLWWL